MFELPLFPLNAVLFPGTPIQLHIFEERYKRMINLCLQDHAPFGVVLIQRGLEALGSLAEPLSVGCTAEIVNVTRLRQERLNIVALGVKRFRILSLDRTTYPYLVGQVEEYPITNPNPRVVDYRAAGLRIQVERFIQVLLKAGNGQFDFQELPDDPVMLAYMAAALLQISPAQKQELLVLESADDLVERLQSMYRREIALLRVLVARGGQAQGGSFSVN